MEEQRHRFNRIALSLIVFATAHHHHRFLKKIQIQVSTDMVSRFFSAIGEVLAPTLQTPLEDFRLHWRAIKHFYIDDKGSLPFLLSPPSIHPRQLDARVLRG